MTVTAPNIPQICQRSHAIKLFVKTNVLYFAATAAAGVIGFAFFNQGAIVKQLDTWQLLPQPQRVTELFFTNPLQLPKAVRLGAPHDIAFTLHNIEHERMTYQYTITAVLGSDATNRSLLKSGTVALDHDKSQEVVETIHTPSVGTPVALQVDLEYQKRNVGDKTGTHRQSIRYWVKVVGIQS